MSKKNFSDALLRSTVLTGFAAVAATAATPAFAQDDEEVREEIFVTGSRIAQKDFVANSPVTTLGQEELDLSGAISVESLLNELPQVVPGLSSSSNNPGQAGQATVDLRGLGPARTLVLMNGRRMTPSDKQGTVDLNVIPAALIDRVEVVTGGASAVYGSDALAGVVNFIMKDDFEGIEYGIAGGQSDRDDATEYTVDVTVGGNFDDGRGNAVLFASYYNREQVLQSERDFSRNALFGSSRTLPSTLENALLNPFGDTSLCDGSLATTDPNFCNPEGRWGHITDGTSVERGPGAYNFAPPNALLLPMDRITIGGTSRYDITDDLEAFVDVLFASTSTGVQLAPAPLAASNRVTVPKIIEDPNNPGVFIDNPYLSADAITLLESRPDPDAPYTTQRRMAEIGPRIQTAEKNYIQMTTGFKGSVFEDWTWEAYYQYGEAKLVETLFNDLSKHRLQSALNWCPEGSPVGCTPINIIGEGTITDAEASWLRHDAVTDKHSYKQHILSGFMAGDIMELPAGPISVALGAEYRHEETVFTPSQISKGDLIGFNGVENVTGKGDVREVYGEIVVPIAAGVPGAEYLGLEGGYRFSHYSGAGEVSTYKIGAEYAPTSDVRFRAMYQSATRAPSIFERTQAGDQNFPRYTDPCSGDVDDASTDMTLCLLQFGLADTPANRLLIDNFNQSDTQVEAFRFGTGDLEPEETDTVTVGVVFTPTFLPWGDLSASLDWYKIEVTEWIGYRSVPTILTGCFDSADPASYDCSLIPPRLPSGDLAGINNPQENRSSVETEGYDLNVRYSFEPEADFGLPIPGSISISNLTTKVETYDFDGSEYVGLHLGLGGAYPEWKTSTRATYSVNDWQFSWQWERIDEMDDYGYTAAYGYPAVAAVDYHDFSARWFINENLEATFVCENCLDEQPQVTVSGYVAGPNVDASTYDTIGRYFRLGLRAKF